MIVAGRLALREITVSEKHEFFGETNFLTVPQI